MDDYIKEEETETRQERRERKLQKKKQKMPQHGKSLGKLYKDAIMKRFEDE